MFYKKQAKILFFSLMLLFIIGVSFFVYKNHSVQAAKFIDQNNGDNISEFSWSSNIGWLSFNSSDCDIDDNNFVDVGCGGDNSSDTAFDYGVDIDATTGVASGYAWSSNYGWICFGDLGQPLCSGATAVYDPATKQLSGNAIITILGNTNGILSLKGGAYGVTWNDNGNREFHGYAWNNNNVGTGIGWVSFNCGEGGPAGANTCGTGHDYAVKAELNTPPVVDNVTINPADDPLITDLAYSILGHWSDDDASDRATAYFCTENAFDYVSGNCNLGKLLLSGTFANPGNPSEGVLTGSIAAGENNLWAFACDEWGACSLNGFAYSFDANDRPVVNNLTWDAVVTEGLEVTPGDSTINFSVDWVDTYNDPTNDIMTLLVCENAAANPSTGCGAGNFEWCSSVDSPAANAGTLDCDHDVANGNTGNKNFRMYVCDGYGICSNAAPNQFFVNTRPEVGVMSAPNFDSIAACGNPVLEADLQANLKWSFTDGDAGDRESDYKIEMYEEKFGTWIYRDSMNNSKEANLGNTVCSKIANPADCNLSLTGLGGVLGVLDWDKSYSFTVSVHDGTAWSESRAFEHDGTNVANPDSLTDDSGVNNSESPDEFYTFTTYAQNFPMHNGSNVTFLPDPPSAGEEVKITPTSQYFTPGAPTTALNCFGTGNCSYIWTTTDGVFKGGTDTTEEPIIIFDDDGNMNYEFTVTSPIGSSYSCSTGAEATEVNKELPSWREIY